MGRRLDSCRPSGSPDGSLFSHFGKDDLLSGFTAFPSGTEEERLSKGQREEGKKKDEVIY